MSAQKKKFQIIIDEELCKGCDICIELCAVKVFEKSGQINAKGYYIPIPSHIDLCNGCKICELICPEMAVILEQEIEVKAL